MVGEPEHGRSLRRLVGADALEHAGAVVQRVGEDVDLRLVPVDEVPVHPDLRGRRDRHGVSLATRRGDRVTHGRGATGDRLGARGADPIGGVGLAEEVEHQRGRQDRGTGIGDPLAGDVGRRAVDRLEHRRPGARRVEVRRRRQPDAARHGAAEVGEDVAEQVVGDDHVVALRVLDEVDRRRVDVVVGGADGGELGARPRRTCAARGRRRTSARSSCGRASGAGAGASRRARTRSARSARRPCAC